MTVTLPMRAGEIVYPERDGNPMSDNTLQFQWLTAIKGNLDIVFIDNPLVFVAGDLLWYPVEGNPKVRMAPGVLVVVGRPKNDRDFYQQWKEDNIAPQVVFEIVSPGNKAGEMYDKLLFYERYGVEEYYVYDPLAREFTPVIRNRINSAFETIAFTGEWLSPRLGIRFGQAEGEELQMFHPDGTSFLSFVEMERQRREVAQERDLAAQERNRATQERDAAFAQAQRLAERLRELGVDPDIV